MNLFVDETLLKGSVHNRLACTNCHTAFSKEEHPIRTFQSLRDHSILAAQACKQCHPNESRLYELSIHYAVLKKGTPDAPLYAQTATASMQCPRKRYIKPLLM